MVPISKYQGTIRYRTFKVSKYRLTTARFVFKRYSWKPGLIHPFSVLARHISEGAAPCPYCLAPCQITQRPAQNVIAVLGFSDRGVKMLVKCLQICAHVFIDHPQNCAHTSFRSCAGS